MLTDRAVDLRVSNGHGLSMVLNPFGARIVELRVPDRDGNVDNVVLGFDDLGSYRRHVNLYLGATIGRVANRISGASFQQDGCRYRLASNEGPNHLHGGADRSLDRVIWSAENIVSEYGPGIAFEYLSPHLEEGYPGNLKVRAEYSLSERNELWTAFTAVSDASTPVNLTNHAYWNLGGAGSGSILDHELAIAADHVLATTDDLVPTGVLEAVAGTALDFRRARPIGERLPEAGSQPWPGIDHAFVLNPKPSGFGAVASLRDPASGRTMEILTSEPSFQVYTANRLPAVNGRDGRVYGGGTAICLEPQRLPDSVNRPEFPSVTLTAGQEYRHVTCYRFLLR
jgi:aldose 1-epimerase